MPASKIPLARIRMEEEECRAVLEVLKSGRLREGEVNSRFEREFSRRAGVRHAISASSGTAALHLAYLALIRPGDEVLVPAFTFIATASMVVMAGGKPVFCDIDPRTWVIDPAEIEKKITPRTRAIAGVHLFGNTCDIEAVTEIARRHQLKIIWDAAQSLGSRYAGKDTGAYPDCVCYSFYPGKNMTTGEGGMIVTGDDALAEKIRLLKCHGQREKYDHEIVGLNYRLTEIAAALGLVQLSRLDDFIEKRKKAAARYRAALENHPLVRYQQTTGKCEHSYNYFSLELQTGNLTVTRDQFAAALKEKGIDTAVHYPKPLHQQPCFRPGQPPLPHSENLSSRILTLPMHPFLENGEIDAVTGAIDSLTQKFSASPALSSR